MLTPPKLTLEDENEEKSMKWAVSHSRHMAGWEDPPLYIPEAVGKCMLRIT